MRDVAIAGIICGTVLLIIGLFVGVGYISGREAREARLQATIINRTAPRPETAHERNVDKYLERLDRLVPGR